MLIIKNLIMRVSFNVAKLAKEKGFNLKCDKAFYNNGTECDYFPYDDAGEHYFRPTQEELNKWIREVHRIHIYPVPNVHFIGKDFENYSFCFLNGTERFEDDGTFSFYEDCLEAGLTYVLNYEMEYC